MSENGNRIQLNASGLTITGDGSIFWNGNNLYGRIFEPREALGSSIETAGSWESSELFNRPIWGSTSNSLSTDDIVFVDMEIKNKGDYIEVQQTYIDKRNYKEIIKTFKCGTISAKEVDNLDNTSTIHLRLDQVYDKTESSKNI